jgi:poly(hydroxyalkanoate) granule-associated protein
MANRKIQRNKTQATTHKVEAGSLWLAGVGAISLARKHGSQLLGDLVGEGRRLQVKTTRLASEAGADLRAQVSGIMKPVKARVRQQFGRTGAAIQNGIAGVLSVLGVPSKADIDALSARVGALSRQLKAAK